MEQIQFDSGIRQYRINGGQILRFHPADPNIYARFSQAVQKLGDLEKSLTQQAQTLQEGDSVGLLELLEKADRELKALLNWVFGPGNDFDTLLGGVNLLAMTTNGKRVIDNLLQALEPVLLQGAEDCADRAAQEALSRAGERRKNQC